MNKVRTSVSDVYLDEDGILHVEMFEGADITLEKIKENFQAIKQLLGNNKALVLISVKKGFKFRSEARSYAAQNVDEINRVATVFVVNSFAAKLVVNLYIKFNKPVVPTRMFLSEENALKWLKTFFVMPGEKLKSVKKR
ncbi:MAG: DUF7793 family protein [Bacteroidota bacterium]